jgi:hypothetical protein
VEDAGHGAVDACVGLVGGNSDISPMVGARMNDVRGRRYQISDDHLPGMWLVLDLHRLGEDGKYPIVATESSRAAARRKAQELNAAEGTRRNDNLNNGI